MLFLSSGVILSAGWCCLYQGEWYYQPVDAVYIKESDTISRLTLFISREVILSACWRHHICWVDSLYIKGCDTISLLTPPQLLVWCCLYQGEWYYQPVDATTSAGLMLFISRGVIPSAGWYCLYQGEWYHQPVDATTLRTRQNLKSVCRCSFCVWRFDVRVVMIDYIVDHGLFISKMTNVKNHWA